MFKEKLINNKRVYYSDFLDDFNVAHFFTSRDFSLKENKEERNEICNYLNIEKLIKPSQTHSKNIEFYSKDKEYYPDCDGLITDEKNIGIYLNFADCTPILLYDFKNQIIANLHAGWRGTVKKIGVCAVEKMKEKFNTNPENIIAIIGPTIGFQSFETSKEIIEKLSSTIKDKTGLFKENYADLKGINARQLEEIGLQKIDICPYCTVLDNDKFYSYRKENKTEKRHSSIIYLK